MWKNKIIVRVLAASFPMWLGVASALDVDQDGIDDSLDVCCQTITGVAVDSEGRPVGDIDVDCDVDLADFALIQNGFRDLTVPNCCADENCVGDFDSDCDVDLADFIMIRTGLRGPAAPDCCSPEDCDDGKMDTFDACHPIAGCVHQPLPSDFTAARIRHRGSEQIVAAPNVDPALGFRIPAGYYVYDMALSGDGRKVWIALYNKIPAFPGDPRAQLWSVNTDGTGSARSSINLADLRKTDLAVATNRDGSVAIGSSDGSSSVAFLRASPGSAATLLFDTAVLGMGGCARGDVKVNDSGNRFYYRSPCNQAFYRADVGSTPVEVLRASQLITPHGLTSRFFGEFDIDSSGEQWLIEAEAFDGATNIQYFYLVRGSGLGNITRFEQLPASYPLVRDVNLTDDGFLFAYCQDLATSSEPGNCYVQESGTASRITITDNRSILGDMAFPDDGSRIYVNTAYQYSGTCSYFQEIVSGERVAGGSSRFADAGCPAFYSAQLSEDGQVLASVTTKGLYVLHDNIDGLAGFPTIHRLSYRYEEDRFLVIRAEVTAPNGLERIYLLPFTETGLDPTATVPENQNPFYNERYGGGVNLDTVFTPVAGSPGVWERTVHLCDSAGSCRRSFITDNYRLRIIAVDATGTRAVFQDFTPLP